MIDFHAHLGRLLLKYDPLTVDDMISFMDTYGIEKSVVLPLINPEEEEFYYTTEQALQDCAKHPDRLIPFVNVDPRRATNDGSYDFLPLLKYYAELGCKGFGEILANLPTNDPRFKGIYKACGEVGFPVVFDFGLSTTGVYDPVGMPYLKECLQEFPQTLFVGHGPGWWAEISSDVTPEEKSGYPTGPIKAPGCIDYLLEKYPNLYADLSANSAYFALTRDHEYTREFLDRHSRKLLFGIDRCVPGAEPKIIDVVRGAGLSRDAEEAIFRTNAETMLRL